MRVLIVEDEKLLAESLKTLLERKGFTVETAFDGVSGAEYAETGIYDLLILDVMMPDMDGYAVARQVRQKRCTVPILMLTAKSDLPDRIEGLNAGADYYLTKPFDIVELLACIRALLRRQGGQVDRLVFGNTTLDLDADTLTCGEKKMRLSAKEFDVMRLLMQAGENNTPKESILTHVWGFDSDAVENNVEVYIGFLRKKLKGQQVHAGWRGSGLGRYQVRRGWPGYCRIQHRDERQEAGDCPDGTPRQHRLPHPDAVCLPVRW